MISRLRKNQENAINESINNNFDSGVHFHATGTGKSWIALELILKYNNIYKNRNILWLCEQKSILIEQFDKSLLKDRGYKDVLNNFLVMNYTENKDNNWYDKINSATFWKKPILLIINRQFLVSQKKYEKLKLNIDLIIHDECHSIQNNTTQDFYKYIKKTNENISCLGFSATPYLDIEPYNKIISKYTIYDAYCDDVIVPPKIVWIENDKKLKDEEYMEICKNQINKLYYKKIIVWCGIIEKCYELAELWKGYFTDFDVYIDTSKDTTNIKEYCEKENNAILFCACKHREGSDIKNLDCCIFLDKVENRNPGTFIQCIGRVLRKDKENNKEFGLILDLKASSCIKICDRMNEYLCCSDGFPWKYDIVESTIHSNKIIINYLQLREPKQKSNVIKNYSIQDIKNKFIKKCPSEPEYINRLNMELKMIEDKNLMNYLIRAVDILELTNFIPHVTRGSCGSSLICYLLGISNVDPVQHKISFARFLNEYRESLPDIDFDFPHYLRDEVFLKLELEWPNQVARISNHVHWHEKSALREALRKIGIKKQIPKEEIRDYIKELPNDKSKEVKNIQKELENTFRHYSLHCGGIIFFNDGIPNDLILNKKTLNQIVYDKRDVSKTKNFKIDILSSRGISQLIGIVNKSIDFTDCPYDEKTYKMLQSGNNIGITLAESPLMRKALLMIKPKSIEDIAICLAIIRPAAKETRTAINDIDYHTKFIYDDDAIRLLSTKLNISEDLADKYRRNLSKDKWETSELKEYNQLMNKLNKKDREELEKQLKNLKLYSFCKSHSYSYAQLVYKLAYEKAHNSKTFWESTLKNVCSSYRKWVHLYEASRNGINVNIMDNKDCSIYAETRKKKFEDLSIQDQMSKYGYWNMSKYKFFPNCYFYIKEDEYLFSGLIASLRVISHKPKVIVSLLCTGQGNYIEMIINDIYINAKHYGIKGRAKLKNRVEKTYVAHIAKSY